MFLLERFDDVTLSLQEARQDTSSGQSLSAFRQLQSGAFRVRGSQRSEREITRITTTGEYYGDAIANVEAWLFDIKRKRGELGKLYRRTKATEQAQWCWAELTRVSTENNVNTIFEQPAGLDFTMISPCWNGTHHSGAGWELDSGVHLDTGRALDEGETYILPAGTLATGEVDAVNAGNFHVDNAILTITAGTEDVTSLVFGTEYPEGRTDADLSFVATIPAGQSLVIDCGARSVLLNGVDAYDDLVIGEDHKLVGLLRLYPGTTTIGFLTTSDDDITVTLDYSDGHE